MSTSRPKVKAKAGKMSLPPGFTRLSPSVSICDPSTTTTTSTSTSSFAPPNSTVITSASASTLPASTLPPSFPAALPSHIQPALLILCTWASASATHIAKYTAAYSLLLPQTRILLIQGTMYDLFFRPRGPQRGELRAAVDVVRAVQTESAEGTAGAGGDGPKRGRGPNGVFVHMLSSGGVHKGTLLASMLLSSPHSSPSPSPSSISLSSSSASSPPGPGLHPRAILVDSAPTLGRDTRSFFVPAVLASFPPMAYPVRLLAVVALNAFWCLLWAMALFKAENPVQMVAGRLLRAGLFGEEDGHGDGKESGEKTRWGYVYSEADKVVGVEDVRWHVARVREMGRVVAVEKCFRMSGHVNHLREEGGVYWNLVAKLLNGDGDEIDVYGGNGLK